MDDLAHMLGRLPYFPLLCTSYVLDKYTLRLSIMDLFSFENMGSIYHVIFFSTVSG